MRRAFYLFLLLALYLSPATLVAQASDWVEDESVQTMQAPRPAPSFRKPAPPPVNPSDYSDKPAPAPSKETAFYANPADSGGRHPLEANVSKWGLGGGTNNGKLQGSADTSIRTTFQLSAPHSESIPPSVFRGWLERTHRGFALSTSTMSSDLVVEVKGAWDDSDRTLRALGIRHTSVRGGKLVDMSLDGTKVIVVNCPGKVPREALQKIRDFVARGGYLLTTDWSVENLLERAFPGYVAYNGAKASQTMVDATVMQLDPALFAGAVTNAWWKMDEGSELIRVLKPDSVRILVRSRQLVADDPDRMGILAVTFPFGRGQVLHLVGHFDNNAGLGFLNTLPDPAPGIGIALRQALASNFIVEGLSH